MEFKVIPYGGSGMMIAQHACFLVNDNWDDYSFKTLFHLHYFDEGGRRIELGDVKVMSRGMQPGRVSLPPVFTSLSPEYCSLGQTQEFYETLLLIRDHDRQTILDGLRDVVWNDAIYRDFEEERAFQASLLRGVSSASIAKFRDIIRQTSRSIPYNFAYSFSSGHELRFQVIPDVTPPTNIHIVIGRNGVGKTRLLSAISRLLRGVDQSPLLGRITFSLDGSDDAAPKFANLIDVAFSVFDEFEPPPVGGTPSGIQYSYIGLRRAITDSEPGRPKSLDDFTTEFVRSTLTCLRSSRRHNWQSAMAVLETDPIFATMELSSIDEDQPEESIATVFKRASSGHKIVLLTMTRLVELVSERTLVLIDEPEAHLHPPLAASFIRALSALLAARNGVAILATHSPVMLQEVPQDCVWLLFRSGQNVDVERSQIETFAENLGVLTREVFRLEVTNSGYHALIANAVTDDASLEKVIERFRGHLGAEGRAIARVLLRKDSR